LAHVTKERDMLVETKGRLEERIRRIQTEIKHRYSTGRTSVDEWLTRVHEVRQSDAVLMITTFVHRHSVFAKCRRTALSKD
jgi:hypothetical protein